MKKIFYFVLFLAAFQMQAQSFSKSFDPKAYAQQLTEHITGYLRIADADTREKIHSVAEAYAYSIHKHLVLYEQQGELNVKSLDEAIDKVKSEAKRASGFEWRLAKIVGEERVEALKERNII